jgi:outer membrane protein OmpA-like peptidoglycan-associated protein
MHTASRVRLRSAVALFALIGSSIPSIAGAQVIERFTLRGEGAVGLLLTSFQRDVLRDSPVGVNASGRLSFFLYDPLALQVSAGQWFFPSDTGGGGLVTASGGIRLEPRIGTRGRVQIDANAGAGFTGSITRFGFDVGIGVEYLPTRFLGLGPVLRYQYLLRTEQDVGESPQMISLGLSVSLRVPPREPVEPVTTPTPRDTDADGVVDDDDRCVSVPAGDHPDPTRRGCPIGDRDQDHVLDDTDACPDVPAGAHPDPARAGCPIGDRDGDGVLDDTDVCADVPAGAEPDPHRAGCPDGDDDRDAVTNARDVCPTQPRGLHPDPARVGCPLPDRDGDSVPDATDHCPDRPGAPSTDPNRNGCPSTVSIEGGFVRIQQMIQFQTDRDRLLPQSIRTLRNVADVLRATPEIRRVVIEGHTDDTGNAEHNQDLSERRARAVLAWLTAHGVEASRLETRGFGATQPLRQGTDRASRAANRRVYFHIVDPALPDASPAPTPAPTTTTTTAPTRTVRRPHRAR